MLKTNNSLSAPLPEYLTALKCRLKIMKDQKVVGTFSFDILAKEAEEKYIIRTSTQHCWYKNNSKILVEAEN